MKALHNKIIPFGVGRIYKTLSKFANKRVFLSIENRPI